VQTRSGPFGLVWRNARDGKEQRGTAPVADGKNLTPPADGEWILQLQAK
jgi:hypothetical protein